MNDYSEVDAWYWSLGLSTFPIGCRVRVFAVFPFQREYLGKVGTIVDKDTTYVLIQFDDGTDVLFYPSDIDYADPILRRRN